MSVDATGNGSFRPLCDPLRQRTVDRSPGMGDANDRAIPLAKLLLLSLLILFWQFSFNELGLYLDKCYHLINSNLKQLRQERKEITEGF